MTWRVDDVVDAKNPSAKWNMPIQVTLNGRIVELAEPVSISNYLEGKGLIGRRIAVAHNGDVVSSDYFSEVVIDDGDTVEIVRPVGGG